MLITQKNVVKCVHVLFWHIPYAPECAHITGRKTESNKARQEERNQVEKGGKRKAGMCAKPKHFCSIDSMQRQLPWQHKVPL